MKVCSVCRRCYDNFDTSCVNETHPALSETHAGGREMVEGYSLDLLLDSGLRGEIFQAHQLATKAPCLVRLISTSEKERERSVREAKTAAAIFHPNVADTYEAGVLDGGQVFIVSESPAGQTLREFLTKYRVPELLTSIQILSQIADALHTLHLNDITHNAVRPENIVLATDTDGYLQVRVQNIDHGGVGFRSIISNKFMIDSALDSLRYFAPEQCTGESAGPATDVYSLGVVFYEMIAGRPPFDATSATALIHKQKNERPPDVRIENFQLRMLLTHTLMESLQKQPAYRPASADKFARQMRHMEQLATHVSTPPPAGAVPETAVRPTPVVTAAPQSSTAPLPIVINVPEPAPVVEHSPEPVHVEPAPVLFEEPVHVEPAPVLFEEPVHVEPAPVLFDEPVSEPQPIITAEPVRVEPLFEVPVSEPVSIAAPEPVRETVALADLIPDPLPVANAEVLLNDPIPDPLPVAVPEPIAVVVEPAAVVATEAAAADLAREEAGRTPRRSRLKTWKKKLHAMSASVSQTPQPEKAAMIVDAPEIKVEDSEIEFPDLTTDDKPQFVAKTDDKLQFVAPTDHVEVSDARADMPKVVVPPVAEPTPLAKAPRRTSGPIKFAIVDDVEAEPKPVHADEAKTAKKKPSRSSDDQSAAASIKRNSPRPDGKTIAQTLNPKSQTVSPKPVVPMLETIKEPDVVQHPLADVIQPPTLVVEERVVVATPKKIQWDQPEDDIPSEADVLNVLVHDGMIDESEKYTGHVFTVTAPKSADGPIPAAATVMNPPPVVPAKSADGPVRPATQTSTQRTKKRPPAAATKRPAPNVETTPRAVAPVAIDQEEITLVRPPRQIRIDLDQAATRKPWVSSRPPADNEFFPTLLGEHEGVQHIQLPPTEAMFSTYYSAPVKKTAIPYRTVMFGGGVLVLIVTFLIGDGFVGDHVQSKNESVAAKTQAPRAKKVVPPLNPREQDKTQQPAAVTDDDVLKPLPDNDRLTRTVSDKPVATVEKTAAVRKDTPKTTPVRDDRTTSARPTSKSTDLSDDSSRKPAPKAKAPDPKPQEPKNQWTSTRPRIVKVPN